MRSAEFWQLTIDCHDPARLVSFWAPVLGYDVRPAPGNFATWNDYYLSVGVPADELDLNDPTGGADRLIDPQGHGPAIWFQPVPEGKSVKNRIHLDVYAMSREEPYAARKAANAAWVEELVAAGATILKVLDEPEWGRYYITLADPEGNEFCVG